MTVGNSRVGSDPAASADVINAAVSRIVDSESFTNSERLKSFLLYVVAEAIAGRAAAIRGKTIAQDVYGRSLDGTGGSDNVVRVDARRLRRRLAEYYSTIGASEPIRIHIDSGGYSPRFEQVDPCRASETLDSTVAGRGLIGRTLTAGAIVGAIAVAILLIVWFVPQGSVSTGPSADAKKISERQALREKSPTSLQASNLADQARGMLFPIADVDRQKLASSMFREAIRIDPGHSGGYAGVAHSLATLAILAREEDDRLRLLSEARRMAGKAIDLDPANAWTQSGAAWVAFAEKDFDRAVMLSRRGYELDSVDGHVLDFHAVISLLTGDFVAAREAADPNRERVAASSGVAHRNIFGVASFHLGEHLAAIASFQEATKRGNPVSELSLVFLAASHQAAGFTERAPEYIRELVETWPGFRPDIALAKFYQHQKHVDEVLVQLKSAGWTRRQ